MRRPPPNSVILVDKLNRLTETFSFQSREEAESFQDSYISLKEDEEDSLKSYLWTGTEFRDMLGERVDLDIVLSRGGKVSVRFRSDFRSGEETPFGPENYLSLGDRFSTSRTFGYLN